MYSKQVIIASAGQLILERATKEFDNYVEEDMIELLNTGLEMLNKYRSTLPNKACMKAISAKSPALTDIANVAKQMASFNRLNDVQ